MLSLSDLFSTQTRDEVVGTLLDILDSLELKVTAWQPGQPIRTMLYGIGQYFSDNSQVRAEAIKGGLLDTATKGWLTLLARSLYRVERKLAKHAESSEYSVTNNTGALLEIEPGDLIVAHSVTGKTYRNVEFLSIADGATDAAVLIIADEAGTASDAGPGMITQVVSDQLGIVVTNPAAVLGSDDELDEPLRGRCRAKLGSLSPNGPRAAYEYVATTPELAATSVAITRVHPVPDPTTGEVTCYLATASGAPSAPDIAVVDAALEQWCTPWCTESIAAGATDNVLAITYTSWVKGSSLSEAQKKSAIATALAQAFKVIPIGGDKIPPDLLGKVYVGALERIIGGAVVGTVKVTVTTPAADVTLAASDVAKLGALTGTIVEVPA